MRALLTTMAVALLGFGGQALAGDGLGFSLPFCAPSAPSQLSAQGQASKDGSLWNNCTAISLAVIGGVIVAVALAIDNNDHSRSA